WIAGLASDPAVPESFRGHLIAQFSSPSDRLYQPGVPLDLQLKNPSATVQKIADENAKRIIDGQDGEDLDYHFRTGQLDAAAVLARVEKEVPELAARDPLALRTAVFNQLAAVNLPQAVSLLSGLPEPQRRDLVTTFALESYSIQPQELLETLNYVPPRTQQDLDLQRDLWERSTRSFQTHREEYPAWVQALPPGRNREFALCGLAEVTADPQLAARLRDLITDPALKKKAALHAP
ncbi:MAG: hypothetical protein JWO82_486, partial [Akkermansiaceae bacterium]|nr:hypothetical protein [Akkermansiaceae bacterium]